MMKSMAKAATPMQTGPFMKDSSQLIASAVSDILNTPKVQNMKATGKMMNIMEKGSAPT